ncbi:hypothetical protein ppKF707_0558 [Metapseudomonas furukawaii]|nr:hypothetical protein ppKF707_0558 [Pseudomonas furukawaii]
MRLLGFYFSHIARSTPSGGARRMEVRQSFRDCAIGILSNYWVIP